MLFFYIRRLIKILNNIRQILFNFIITKLNSFSSETKKLRTTTQERGQWGEYYIFYRPISSPTLPRRDIRLFFSISPLFEVIFFLRKKYWSTAKTILIGNIENEIKLYYLVQIRITWKKNLFKFSNSKWKKNTQTNKQKNNIIFLSWFTALRLESALALYKNN